MRQTLIAGNWKMNLTVTEAEKFFKNFNAQMKENVELLICPPFTDIPLARFFLERSSVKWGAQDVYPSEKGAFTGEISPTMLKDLGCTYVICGHSERRKIIGESDEFVAQKVQAVLNRGLVPILCVGETLEEKEAGKTQERIGEEINAVFTLLKKDEIGKIVIAYEPIWAIGSGRAATAEDAEEISAFIRKAVEESAGKIAAETVRILYGGSVNADNIVDFLKEKDIDGGLIGGASLSPESFLAIYRNA